MIRFLADHSAMAVASDYDLIDCGEGRRLERFGSRTVDRPAPGAVEPRHAPSIAWSVADARFYATAAGRAATLDRSISSTRSAWSSVSAHMVSSESFPSTRPSGRGFATGSPITPPRPRSCICSAIRGSPPSPWPGRGQVTHVDSARPTVAWARHNADLSGLAERPVRWIVDDAVAYTEREVRRGRRYAGVVLDPPSYGHGPGREPWRIDDHLAALLTSIARLLEPDGFVLLTAHTPDFTNDRLASMVAAALRATGRSDRGRRTVAHDRGRPPGLAGGVRAHDGRGMMARMGSPTPALLTSFANPRVKAALGLRDRRERDGPA